MRFMRSVLGFALAPLPIPTMNHQRRRSRRLIVTGAQAPVLRDRTKALGKVPHRGALPGPHYVVTGATQFARPLLRLCAESPEPQSLSRVLASTAPARDRRIVNTDSSAS